MRILGVDYGRKRIGLALSDVTAVLARPWKSVPAGASARDSAMRIAAVVDEARDPLDDDSGIGAVVVGLPRRLDGSDNEATRSARDLAEALGETTGLSVHLQDERLSSREAESQLAQHEPDWRRRKAQIDAVAAAIILQDYLDGQGRATAGSARPW